MFEAKIHAKIILTGEHSVLRGGYALVVPIKTKILTLSYTEDPDAFQMQCKDKDRLCTLFLNTLAKAMSLTEKHLEDLTGNFLLSSNIPMGAGMGFSAALCVAIAQWMHWKKWIHSSEVFNFSKQLEDSFHGKSSGLDIAGVMSDKIVFYKMDNHCEEMILSWKPKLFLSFTSKPSVTGECIQKVKELWDRNPSVAKQLDIDMQDSVFEAKKALETTEEEGLLLLQQSIHKAYQCFNRWHLISKEMNQHISNLKAAGAMAAKPTGGGYGGIVLSLWKDDQVVNDSPYEMLPILLPAA